MGCRLHLAQKGVHLLRIEAAAGTHRRVTGKRARNLLHPLLQRERVPGFGNIVRQIADQRARIGLAQHGGNFAHQDRIGTERLDHKPKFGQFAAAGGDTLYLGRIKLHHLRNQKRLAGDAAIFQRALHPLINQTFMGGMLIHDHHTIGGLGHDIGFMQLRAGKAQRQIIRLRIICLRINGSGRGQRRPRPLREQWCMIGARGIGKRR